MPPVRHFIPNPNCGNTAISDIPLEGILMPKTNVTQKFIDNNLVCPAGKKSIEFNCLQLPGFYVSVTAISPGIGTFVQSYKDPAGRRRHVKIARTCDIPLKEARKRGIAIRADVLVNGGDPQSELMKKRRMLTVEEYATQHFLPWIKVRKRSWRNDKSILYLRVIPSLGHYRLDQVSRHKIETLHNRLLEEGMSGAHADHHLKTIRFMYNKAIEHGFFSGKNPAAGIKQFNFDNKIERYLDDAELARLLKVLDKDPNRPVANVILMLLSTGLRLGSCLSATWSNVDLKNKNLTIDASHNKSAKKSVIPLNNMAIKILSELDTKGKHTHLFVSSRTGEPLRSIKSPFKRILKEAGIVNFRTHDLRHCFCSYALQQGRSIAEVSELAGHSSVQITMRYAHFAKGQLHAASNSAADHINAVRIANSDE